MGTSSNFGNMFSAAGAAAVLPFLPMLPFQILLNNLLYDAGQLTIPTDHVDPEQVQAPARWGLHMIRRFMLLFGPLSSLFDLLTFAILIGPLHAGPELFRSGWFVESLATQTLVIFAIRTRRVPFLRSRPSVPLTVATLAVVATGVVLPFSPLAGARLPARADGLPRRPDRARRGLPAACRSDQALLLRHTVRARAAPPPGRRAPAAPPRGPVQPRGSAARS